ncbi:MAG: Cytosine-specific methyltransferase [Candidatus Nomurabacteria bacterium GW2011_GWF2_35_66]|uniref:Cytosine-specific methyltransferase n=1 Tax=Candidatus Nomurabacteria bacterium GW2011_GWE1_35_16 TaxID=1618761 RepID=A0A0G0EGN7_9BACT|nr:MAG: Cytosine-specific methyltransferase [Candidatus Nomurabacteria bacterium GW2011_GWF1_34_20]KKP63279.1 MAG: Cytosine-specific methyltransferase [Candidatus Nomurabacteria bacterium GW2011_GWE2_34_25]KKP66477.1 MAG: Cytosine-specific methyltransferase [Candidatus Nomurabacteria bacterium GW2011_GWE1_35_16]KKP83725.1 MAG: Cytosine-specific methyltransferase [Candidatus Nomurabacteria bacterium GW2011_GWF2_35_66]HAE36415.1 DNA (cytosine-5-)-methyltransferase [Candidatus Nomurabacteria bacte
MVKPKKSILKVAELFAGVGGFRIGLDRASKKDSGYITVWNNQWEPATKKQHASETYIARFGEEGHSNVDIAKVKTNEIPNHDLLVGGFPCQDYSVARNLGSSNGIIGKKGVLWWEIHRILKEKGKNAPSYLMLENVDRLLKSPALQRGRDFAMIISSLNDLDYIVEWRVINAADYGMPQRRRRTFIMGYKKGTSIYNKIFKLNNHSDWIKKGGVISSAFPVLQTKEIPSEFTIVGDLPKISETFNKENPTKTLFANSGISIKRKIYTLATTPNYEGERTTLKDIIIDEKDVPQEFFIKKEDLPKWEYLKGAKSDKRTTASGFSFVYTEGAMVFPDSLDKPSRTIITAEGGSTPSRFKHVIKTPSGKLRRLTPVELEKLCMFPPNHTVGQPDVKRAFFMGNALVVGVIEKLGKSLKKQIDLN